MNGVLRFVHCWCCWCYSIWRETGTASEEEDGVRIFAGRLEANFDSESLKYKNRR
jgi:hypothetical protein